MRARRPLVMKSALLNNVEASWPCWPAVRLLSAALVLVLLAPFAVAQAGETRATLDIAVQADHGETLTLTFSGLKRLTQYQGICLPDRAVESRVYDDLGDIPYSGKTEGARRIIDFAARTDKVIVDMARPVADDADHPLYAGDVNFCVPQQSRVIVNVVVPDGHILFFLSDNGKISGGKAGTTSSDGPTHVFYSYEAPLAGRKPMEIFEEGAFRVFVTPDLAESAREIASLSAAPYDAALAEAGLPAPFDKMRVLFGKETPFAWESGHYNGHGYVAVKESALVVDRATGYPYTAVKVLVHESFHAASFPFGQGEVTDKLSWFLEGTARHAERQVDVTMPDGALYCQKAATEVRCWGFDDRIAKVDLEQAYGPSFTFDPKWEPSLPQSEDTRRFYYALSEFLVAAWIQQNGEASYQKVWGVMLAAFNDDQGCPCETGWLRALLDDPDLFAPWADLRQSDPSGFDARITPFLKDDTKLQAELNKQTGPLSGLPVPAPMWGALAAMGAAAVLVARRRGQA